MADSKEMENIDESSKLHTDGETAKIKFQQSTNGEAKVDMPDSVGYQCGLTKEELMKYANDPFWVFLRRLLFVLFWVLWIGMLVGAVVIIMMTPSCEKPKDPEWFQTSLQYQLDAKTFNPAGNSTHIKSIIQKLHYLKGISVSAIVIDGLFDPEKPGIIAPEAGSFDEFPQLSSEIKTILKIPINKMNLGPSEKSAFVATLIHWLEKGAAGFLFDGLESIDMGNLDIKGYQTLISNHSTEELPRALLLSSYGDLDKFNDICNNSTVILDYTLTKLRRSYTAEELYNAFEPTTRNSSKCVRSLVLSNGDIQPLIDRFDAHERDRLMLFTFLANTAPYVYSGEETARSDPQLPSVLTRGSQAIPMKWVDVDQSKIDQYTFFKVYQNAARLRYSEKSIVMGNSTLKLLNEGKVLGLSRIVANTPGFAVVSNFSPETVTVDVRLLSPNIPDNGEIDTFSTNSEYKKASKVDLGKLVVHTKETVVVQFVPKKA